MIKKISLLLLITTSLFISCSSTPKETPKPNWVDNPKSVYPDDLYISRVGEGYTKQEALNDAQLELAKYFGQNVSSTVVGKENWVNSSENGVSKEQSLSKEYVISFDTTLFAVEKTKPWYDVYTENYYVCSYIDREQAFNIYKPTLLKAREQFYKFYEESINEKDLFKQLQLLKTTKLVGEAYLTNLNLAQTILPSVYDHYKKDYKDISNVDVMLQKLKNNAAVKIETSGNYGNKISDTVAKYFINNGFKVSNNNYNYIVNVDINENRHVDDYSGMIETVPTISISMNDKSNRTSYFTYTKTLDKQQSYNEQKIFNKTLNAFEDELAFSFENELQDFLKK